MTVFFPFSSYRKVISSLSQEPIFKVNRGLTIGKIPKVTNTATQQTGIQAVSEHGFPSWSHWSWSWWRNLLSRAIQSQLSSLCWTLHFNTSLIKNRISWYVRQYEHGSLSPPGSTHTHSLHVYGYYKNVHLCIISLLCLQAVHQEVQDMYCHWRKPILRVLFRFQYLCAELELILQLPPIPSYRMCTRCQHHYPRLVIHVNYTVFHRAHLWIVVSGIVKNRDDVCALAAIPNVIDFIWLHDDIVLTVGC